MPKNLIYDFKAVEPPISIKIRPKVPNENDRKIETPLRLTPYVPKKSITVPEKYIKNMNEKIGYKLPFRSQTVHAGRAYKVSKFQPDELDSGSSKESDYFEESQDLKLIPQANLQMRSFTESQASTRIYDFKIRSLSISGDSNINIESSFIAATPLQKSTISSFKEAVSSTRHDRSLSVNDQVLDVYQATSLDRSRSPNRQASTAFPMTRVQKEQLNEILSIKSRLASKKLSCPIEILEAGLLSNTNEQEMSFDPNNLPRGGENLINNPFMKIRKKKKGKKKGKKKKR